MRSWNVGRGTTDWREIPHAAILHAKYYKEAVIAYIKDDVGDGSGGETIAMEVGDDYC